MWRREIDGRSLTFRLAGINNQNFLMRDDETGSFWQQISGRAISGPLRGRQLAPVHSDELTFALWRAENPKGAVLRPITAFASQYESKDWDVKMARVRSVIDTRLTGVPPRELVIGVQHGGKSRAYLVSRVTSQKVVQDSVAGEPVILVAAPDGKSIRAFSARIPDATERPEFYSKPNGPDRAEGPVMMDSVTGSGWSFKGCAVEGPAAGQCLSALPAVKDYWFDWHLYHPDTTVFGR